MLGFDGVGISLYRSFGPEIQRIGPFVKINLLIGQNNVGKSNILNFISRHYSDFIESVQGKKTQYKFSPIDKNQGIESPDLKIKLGLKINGAMHEELIRILFKNEPKPHQPLVEKILQSKALTCGTSTAWFPYIGYWGGGAVLDKSIVQALISEDIAKPNDWYPLWTYLTRQQNGTLEQHWVYETIKALSPAIFTPPPIYLIPAIRKIGEAGTSPHDYSGIGIIDRLAELQSPSFEKPELRAKFDAINLFVQSVFDDTKFLIEVPHDKKDILINKNGKRLPLSSQGTGLHEVITLAVAATVLDNTLICLEEPELHLHPLLQKKLMWYFSTQTTNDYLISTHSAHLLDTPEAQIFHVRLVDGRTRVENASTNHALSSVCDDLGYRPSDLLQSNCIIWVEGPSDRLYLNHWIQSIDDTVLEGIHYSIMFYGGRLLSHLSADEEEVKDFISLRRLNRHMVIVLDSDRTNEADDLNDTKTRVVSEFTNEAGFAWVTQGREIENYINTKLLENSLQETHPQFHSLGKTGIYDHVYQFKKKDGGIAEVKEVDKIKLAHSVAKSPPKLGVLDLDVMVAKVVAFVHQANGTQFTV